MLQDLEAGQELELAAIVGAVVELADLTGLPAPALRSVYAATDLIGHRSAEMAARRRAHENQHAKTGTSVAIPASA